MDRNTAIILTAVMTVMYLLLVWVVGYFGPGGKLFMSTLYVLFMLFLMPNVFPKKKK